MKKQISSEVYEYVLEQPDLIINSLKFLCGITFSC